MKKTLLITALIGVLILTLGIASSVYAQENIPQTNFGTEHPVLRRAMITAIAETLGMTTDDLAAARKDGQTLADLVENQGLSMEEFSAGLAETITAMLDQSVADGKITQEQADNFQTRWDTWKENRTDEHPLRDAMKVSLAETLGMTVNELVAAHEEGQTASEFAEAQGLSLGEFCTLVDKTYTTALDQAIADGTVTQEQADTIQARWQDWQSKATGFLSECAGTD